MSAGTGTYRNRVRAGYENKRLQNVLKAHRQRMRDANQEVADDLDEEVEDDAVAITESPPLKPKRSRSTSTSTAQTSGRAATEEAGEDGLAPPAPKKRRARPAKSTVASRKKAEQARRDARAAERGGRYSSEEDLSGPVRPTIASQPRPKRKATKKPTREVASSSGE
ncbi:hypothetical protein ACM66B_001587 [Microbotryomycetes sp. NB124-2]